VSKVLNECKRDDEKITGTNDKREQEGAIKREEVGTDEETVILRRLINAKKKRSSTRRFHSLMEITVHLLLSRRW
jgi:hypothetical protein